MKKFLALLFVCAGLTAMAGVPQINKAGLAKLAKSQKVMKANTLSHELTAPMMMNQKNALTPRQVTQKYGFTLKDNKLNKRAPRRLSNEDIAANSYLDFRYAYILTDSGIVADDPHYLVNQSSYWTIDNGQLYAAGIVWSPFSGQDYYHPIDIDYETGLVSYGVGYILDDDTISGKPVNVNPATYVDTIFWSAVVDADFYFNNASEFTPVTGALLEDGSIEFNDSLPFVVFGYEVHQAYTRSGTAWTGYTYNMTSSDTIESAFLYFGSQFMVPNATHDNSYRGKDYSDPVYVMQPNDTTVISFGLWGMGEPGTVMFLHEDGTMDFPAQYVYDASGNDFINSSFELDEDHGFIFNSEGYVDGFLGFGNTGNVTPEAITWDHTVLATEEGSLFYPFYNNVLKLNEGQFVIPQPAYLRGDVNNDGKVNIGDVTDLISALLTGVFDDAENFSSDNADCDLDGEYKIGDVTTLIAYLLSGNWPAE